MIAIGLLFIRMLCDFFKPRPRLEVEILILRHQLNILQRKLTGRAAFKSIDRLVFAGLYRLVPGVLDALKILKPETVILWHRAGFDRGRGLANAAGRLYRTGTNGPRHGRALPRRRL